MTRSLLLLLAACGLIFAQDQPSTGGWRRAGDRPPQPAPAATVPAPPSQVAKGQDPEPVDRSDSFGQPAQAGPQQGPQEFPQEAPPQGPPQQSSMNRPAYGLPPDVTLRPGTYVTVRIEQPLSSDRNQAGDTFVASLA